MSSLAHTQGGLRPAFAHDATFHPGLQVHAIAEPRGNRRLSLLISFLCYESMAAVVLLTMQHREAIVEQIKTHSIGAILDTVEARIAPPPVLPAPPLGVKAHDLPASALPSSRAVEPNLDTPPAVLPSVDNSTNLVGRYSKDGLPYKNSGGETPPGTGHPSTNDNPSVLELTGTQVQVLHQAEPIYPAMARIIKIQGDVVVRMTIDTTGHPSDVKVLSGPEQLRGEALRCARQWRFTPARLGGEAVPAAFNLTLRFVLR